MSEFYDTRSMPLFQKNRNRSCPRRASCLVFDQINMKTAQRLNALWHSRLPKTTLSNLKRNQRSIAFSATFEDWYFAVAIWTDPVAANRLNNGKKLLELRRFAIANDAPKNTGSRMLGWMKKEIKRVWPELIGLISYQDTAVHRGIIYAAANWHSINCDSSPTDWNVNNRKRHQNQSASKKIRWQTFYNEYHYPEGQR